MSDSLEEILNEVSRYGRVWLYMGGNLNSWTSTIEVSMSIVGAKFEVRSDNDHKTAKEALTVLRSRLMDALVSFDGKVFKGGK